MFSSNPQQEFLSRYVSAIFQPIINRADGHALKREAERVRDRFLKHYVTKLTARAAQADPKEALAQIVSAIGRQAITEKTYDIDAIFGIGTEYTCKWRAVLKSLYRIERVQELVEKAMVDAAAGRWHSTETEGTFSPAFKESRWTDELRGGGEEDLLRNALLWIEFVDPLLREFASTPRVDEVLRLLDTISKASKKALIELVQLDAQLDVGKWRLKVRNQIRGSLTLARAESSLLCGNPEPTDDRA